MLYHEVIPLNITIYYDHHNPLYKINKDYPFYSYNKIHPLIINYSQSPSNIEIIIIHPYSYYLSSTPIMSIQMALLSMYASPT